MSEELAKILPPERRLIATRREYLAAFDELIAGARRELCVFDPEGLQLELNAPARIERLRQFLYAGRNNRLLIAVHAVDHIKQRCPRFLRMLAEFSAAISVHQTEGEAERAQDCFVLADMAHFARRPVATAMRGVYARNEFTDASTWRERFDEIWQSSFPAVTATTLGL